MSKNETKSLNKLNLDRSKLHEAIEYFFLSKTESWEYTPLREMKGNRHRLEYIYEGSSNILDFRFNINETTTIDTSVGELDSFKIELAEAIKEYTVYLSPEVSQFENPYFVFENVPLDDVNTVINIAIDELGYKKGPQDPAETSTYVRWRLSSTFNEEVVVTYFMKRGKTVIQGRPLKLFTELYTLFLTFVDVAAIPKVIEQKFQIVNVQKSDVASLLETYLPNALSSGRLPSKVEKVLYQCAYNLHVKSDMFDYTFLAFPSLRALEGHLKHIMKAKDISLEDRKFSMFTKVGKNFMLQEIYRDKFNDQELIAVNDCFNFFNKQRNNLFHWDTMDKVDSDRTKILENISSAHKIITNTFEIIDSYYNLN